MPFQTLYLISSRVADSES